MLKVGSVGSEHVIQDIQTSLEGMIDGWSAANQAHGIAFNIYEKTSKMSKSQKWPL